ncbi:Olfactory receptor 4A47 [Sciurus carolinensis]|uniref:Olfactory receptor 4A47 n=1 Tax=Sciurus carolinensis TaxID=30640 RepID=A0AA41SQT5_SCICA|nr:Olfactory receptor 4A47 [Sciurus carolinensis]
MDLCYTSTMVPQLIRDLAATRKIISYNSCMTQLFTAHLLAGVEIFILVSMALDRYVAIVKRLHYMAIMNQRKCNLLVVVAWGVGFWHSIALLLMVLRLPFGVLTCSLHVTVVVLFFVPCIYTYVLPAGSENKDKEISVFYTVVAPMLNPLIYMLRNMEMNIAMQKVWARMSHR